MGLQPPKPQLAAQSACLEECEGLLMVTPSLTVLGHTLLSLTLFFSHTHKIRSQTNMLTHTNVHMYRVHTETETHTQAGTESLSL